MSPSSFLRTPNFLSMIATMVLAPLVLHAQISNVTTVGYTTYDYAFRTGGPVRLAYYREGFANPGRSLMMFIQRDHPADPPVMAYVNGDGNTFSAPQPIIPADTQTTNAGSIDVWRGGERDGRAIAAVGNTGGGLEYLATESSPGQGEFALTRIGFDSTANILVLDSTGLVLCQDMHDGDYRIWRSADFGATFVIANPGIVSTTPLPGGQDAYANPSLALAPDGAIVLGTTLKGKGAIPPVGTSPSDSANLFGYFRSTDRGATWVWTTITRDGAELFPGHYYLPQVVSQFSFVADTHAVHCVFSGYNLYGVAPHPDSLRPSTDVVYWDSAGGFKSLVNFDRTLPILAQVIGRRSGDAWGCAYPSIAMTDDGQTIYCTWSQPNFTPTSIDTGANGFMMYDLWLDHAERGFWTYPTALTSTTDRSELFGTMAPRLENLGGASPRGRILYIADRTDGSSVLNQGASNSEPVVFQDFITWIDLAVRVDDRVPLGYSLEQNFPNPFNASTTFRFSIPGNGQWHRVYIGIFDLLGRELGTLVYKDIQSGNYQKAWTAQRLSSGVYFYVMKARPLAQGQGMGFTSVKKMVVLR